MEKYLLENNISQKAELESIDSRVKNEIEEAETFAIESAYPESEDGMKGLYATPIVGSKKMKEITYLEAIKEALDEEMARDPSVFILGEDVGGLWWSISCDRRVF